MANINFEAAQRLQNFWVNTRKQNISGLWAMIQGLKNFPKAWVVAGTLSLGVTWLGVIWLGTIFLADENGVLTTSGASNEPVLSQPNSPKDQTPVWSPVSWEVPETFGATVSQATSPSWVASKSFPTWPVGTQAPITETTPTQVPLVIPGISAEDSDQILKLLWEFPLTQQQLDWLGAFHSDSVDTHNNIKDWDPAELAFLYVLAYSDILSSNIQWTPELTAHIFIALKDGKITTERLNTFEQVISNPAGLQKFLGINVTNTYDTNTQKAFADAIRTQPEVVDFGQKMMTQIVEAQEAFNTQVMQTQRDIQDAVRDMTGADYINPDLAVRYAQLQKDAARPLQEAGTTAFAQTKAQVADTPAQVTPGGKAQTSVWAEAATFEAPSALPDTVEMNYDTLMLLMQDVNPLCYYYSPWWYSF